MWDVLNAGCGTAVPLLSFAHRGRLRLAAPTGAQQMHEGWEYFRTFVGLLFLFAQKVHGLRGVITNPGTKK